MSRQYSALNPGKFNKTSGTFSRIRTFYSTVFQINTGIDKTLYESIMRTVMPFLKLVSTFVTKCTVYQMTDSKKFINTGIVAHVDAGKTSITELFLFKGGAIRSMGSVDKGTSQTDWLPVEIERGISVRSASASIEWQGVHLNIIDTPGHVDFSAEVERSLRALDSAILVISAVEGVQAHTETLWNALRKLNIPILIFINKIDRAGADVATVVQEIKRELTEDALLMQTVSNQEDSRASVTNKFHPALTETAREELTEMLANHDDNLLHKYLNEEPISYDELLLLFKKQFHHGHVFPILAGSAKFDCGIDDLLDFVTTYMPVAGGDVAKPLSGIVYKVEHDSTIGRVASVRLFNGSLKNRDLVMNASQQTEEKVSQIRKLRGQKFEDTGELLAGDCGAICGLTKVRAGDILGTEEDVNEHITLTTPLLTVKILSEKETDFPALVAAMQLLADEDPTIDLLWLQDERELHIKIIGLIQLEILESILLERFNLKVSFDEPTVIYKETPLSSGEGYEEYTMPKPCWAVINFLIEPGPLGSGLHFESKVGVNQIAARYQNEIERTLPKALQQGIHGWEVTDLKITLQGGEHHNIHSRAGDFAIATPMAIMNGLQHIGTQLLEPMLEFTITAPEDTLGKIASQLTLMRAEFGNPELTNGKFILKGKVPVATSLDYPAKLSSITGGKGKFKTAFTGYRPCPLELGKTTPFRGISPLDRAKYILKARKAIQ